VHEPPRILVVDDNPNNVDILKTRLESHGYEIVTAADGEAALIRAVEDAPDLILLDLMMPGVDGLEVCRRLKSNRNVPFTPIVIITAKSDAKDVIAGLGAGADEYLTKPVDHASLVARVASMLRIKALQDTVEAQRRQIATWNEALQQKVKAQVDELDRLGRLKGFFSPQLAEAIVSAGADEVLKPHRREITVVYLDLRGFTQFTDSAEPEEVMNMLSQYHALAGELIMQYQDELGLSDQQKDALRSRLEKLKPEFEKKQQALQQQIRAVQQLLQEKELDESKANSQFEQILARENEMKKLQFGLMIGIRGILSSEQRAKALKLKQDWPQARQQLEQRLRAKMEKVHAGVQKLVDSGTEPSEVGTLMQQFQPLIDAGKVKDAEAVLDQALSLIEEKNKK